MAVIHDSELGSGAGQQRRRRLLRVPALPHAHLRVSLHRRVQVSFQIRAGACKMFADTFVEIIFHRMDENDSGQRLAFA